MSRHLNLKSLLQAKDSLREDVFENFLKHFDVDIRSAEIEDLRSLVEIFNLFNSQLIKMVDYNVCF